MMAYYGFSPSLNIVFLPLFLLLALVGTLAISLWLSALNVEFRDVRHTVPFLTQLWLFATPVAYPSSLLSEPWRTLYGLNPMAGVIEGFRWALLGSGNAPGGMVIASAVIAVILLLGGAFYFRRMERTFADII
jgi:lipopolysaccharide transport system permease protein